MGRTIGCPAMKASPNADHRIVRVLLVFCAYLYLCASRGWQGDRRLFILSFPLPSRKPRQAFYERDSVKTSANCLNLDLNLGPVISCRQGARVLSPRVDAKSKSKGAL